MALQDNQGRRPQSQCITEYVVANQQVCQLELHTLPSSSSRAWPSPADVAEIVTILKPVLESRVPSTVRSRRWRGRRAETKDTIVPTKPRLITTSSIRLAYSFKATPVQQQCVLQGQRHGQYRGMTFFKEKVVVHACRLQDYKDSTKADVKVQETISSYFVPGDPAESAVAKPKLSKPAKRRNRLKLTSSSSAAIASSRETSDNETLAGAEVKKTTHVSCDVPAVDLNAEGRESSGFQASTSSTRAAGLPARTTRRQLTLDSFQPKPACSTDQAEEGLPGQPATRSVSASTEEEEEEAAQDQPLRHRRLSLEDRWRKRQRRSEAGPASHPGSSISERAGGPAEPLAGSPGQDWKGVCVGSEGTVPPELMEVDDGPTAAGGGDDDEEDIILLDDPPEKLSVEESIPSVKHVRHLNTAQLAHLVKAHEQELLQIFSGKKASWKHEDYKTGGTKRNLLKYKVPVGCFQDWQHDAIIKELMRVFCRKHTKYLDYLLKVLLPEVLIRIYMHVHRVDYLTAEIDLMSDPDASMTQ